MNKILLEDNTSIKDLYIEEDSIIVINNRTSDVNYHISKSINIFTLITDSSFNLNVSVFSNAIVNIFSVNSSMNVKLDLLEEGIDFNYNYSTINENNNCYNVDINHYKNSINSKIINHGINLEDKKLDFIINTVVPKDILNIKTNQDSKIIVFKDNNATIKPNLFIDSDDIEANHSAYIGQFKKEDLFYLMTRGIDLKHAEELMIKSFLMGNLNISFREKDIVLENIKKYWR